MQIFGGQIRCIMADEQVAYENVVFDYNLQQGGQKCDLL